MEILKFESNAPKARRKKKSSNKPMFVIVGVAAVAVLGSTLAASITINSSQNVEFGQGVAQTSSCDPTDGITVNPSATFTNAEGAGSFKFGTIAFTGIHDDCLNKVFTIKAYNNSNASPITLNTSGTAFNYATFAFKTVASGSVSSNVTGSNYATGSNAGTYSISFNGTQSDPAGVFKITLESSAS